MDMSPQGHVAPHCLECAILERGEGGAKVGLQGGDLLDYL